MNALGYTRQGATYAVTITPALLDGDELVELNDETGVQFSASNDDRTPGTTLLAMVGPAEPFYVAPGTRLGDRWTIVGALETHPPPSQTAPPIVHGGDEPEPTHELPAKPFPWGWLVAGVAAVGVVYAVASD